jgi:cbb3-type cytochrome oxidase maturation protein
MESLYVLVPLSVALVFLIGWVFWRALAGGQFDDLDRPATDLLTDDDRPEEKGGQSKISSPTSGLAP